MRSSYNRFMDPRPCSPRRSCSCIGSNPSARKPHDDEPIPSSGSLPASARHWTLRVGRTQPPRVVAQSSSFWINGLTPRRCTEPPNGRRDPSPNWHGRPALHGYQGVDHAATKHSPDEDPLKRLGTGGMACACPQPADCHLIPKRTARKKRRASVLVITHYTSPASARLALLKPGIRLPADPLFAR